MGEGGRGEGWGGSWGLGGRGGGLRSLGRSSRGAEAGDCALASCEHGEGSRIDYDGAGQRDTHSLFSEVGAAS